MGNSSGAIHHDKVCNLVERFSGQDVIRVAEVGVHAGRLSRRLLATFPAVHLSMIDHWLVLPEDHRDWEAGYSDQDAIDAAYVRARAQTAFAGDRRKIYPITSESAAKLLTLQEFDLVFIDGGHSTETVAEDIRNYWPLVRSGGILSGHDYRPIRSHNQVKLAVDAWVEENNFTLHLHDWWVWHVEKE